MLRKAFFNAIEILLTMLVVLGIVSFVYRLQEFTAADAQIVWVTLVLFLLSWIILPLVSDWLRRFRGPSLVITISAVNHAGPALSKAIDALNDLQASARKNGGV